MSKREHVERLERAGFAAHRAAVELRAVRERYAERDALSPRLQALEEEARTVAGLVAMELRDLDEAPRYGMAEPEPPAARTIMERFAPPAALPSPPANAPTPPRPWCDTDAERCGT